MVTNRMTARIVGACFLFSNVVFLLGAIVFLEPIISAPDYLTLAAANKTKLVVGALLEMLNGVAYLGIAVFMFPVFKKRFESLALGYIAFRVIEFVMQTLSDLSPLAILSLSEEYLKAGSPVGSSFEVLGSLLYAERLWAFQMVSITLVLGAFLFYTMLYKTKLIPRFISIWGLIGAAGVIVNAIMDMLGIPIVNLGVLMLLNELFLGVWLIVKGFNEEAHPTESA
ncbi:MAG: DUF4386 domain-containing protein [Anaerolineales bacterium]